MTRDSVRVGDLLRDPQDRDEHLAIVPLLVMRDRVVIPAPPAEARLHPGDALLLAATTRASAALDSTLMLDAVASYVFSGITEPTSALLRVALRRNGTQG